MSSLIQEVDPGCIRVVKGKLNLAVPGGHDAPCRIVPDPNGAFARRQHRGALVGIEGLPKKGKTVADCLKHAHPSAIEELEYLFGSHFANLKGFTI